MTRTNALDQFYTRPETAQECFQKLDEIAERYCEGKIVYIEPAAGDGAFLEPLRRAGRRFQGLDIEPHGEGIRKMDFLTVSESELEGDLDSRVFIGNPPFGKRSALAVQFLNISLTYSHVVGFILPVQFNKYLTQRRIVPEARLISNVPLPSDSFIERGRPVSIRTAFQIWTNGIGTVEEDVRRRTAPPTSHPDFTMFIYNCTPEAMKFFDYDWDIAVRRQGWGTLDIIGHDQRENLDPRRQYMFFKARDEKILERLRMMDFTALGALNTSVRGFGKADVVSEYRRLYEG